MSGAMALWTKLAGLVRKPALNSSQDVRNFYESRTAYLVQKSLAEYSQARANMLFSTLLSEKAFQTSYEQARWLSFPAGLSMVGETIASAMRTQQNLRGEDAAAMISGLAHDIVKPFPQASGRPEGEWAQAMSSLEADLARAALAEPRHPHDIVKARAREIFDALPFHPAIKQHDFGMFRNTLAFHLTGIAQELEETNWTGFKL
jgi:hypothetical protein